MCTVTYVPLKDGYILTSSRDESPGRVTFPPQTYVISDQKVVFPKDEFAGGTWIASGDKGDTICLLNGAYENFLPEERFTVSRGKILLQFFNYKNTEDYIQNLKLDNVAPFTLVMWRNDSNDLIEFMWDGNKKLVSHLSKDLPHIWASATLYDEKQRKLRKVWFDHWLMKYPDFSEKVMEEFHVADHTQDKSSNILMKRNSGVMTVSITQINRQSDVIKMNYSDLLNSGKVSVEVS